MAKITYIDEKVMVDGVEGTLAYLARDDNDNFYSVHTMASPFPYMLHIGPRNSLQQILPIDVQIKALENGPFSSFGYTEGATRKKPGLLHDKRPYKFLQFAPPDEGSETEVACLIGGQKPLQLESWVYDGQLYCSLKDHLERKGELPINVPYWGW